MNNIIKGTDAKANNDDHTLVTYGPGVYFFI